jgi:hypothetical protein
MISTRVDQGEPGAWMSRRVIPLTCFPAMENHESTV